MEYDDTVGAFRRFTKGTASGGGYKRTAGSGAGQLAAERAGNGEVTGGSPLSSAGKAWANCKAR